MAIMVSADHYADLEIPYCGDCGHFHIVDIDCPPLNQACDSYLCCIPMSDD